jgi:hypothetical protein
MTPFANIIRVNKSRIKLAEHLVRVIRGTNAYEIVRKTDGNKILRDARLG